MSGSGTAEEKKAPARMLCPRLQIVSATPLVKGQDKRPIVLAIGAPLTVVRPVTPSLRISFLEGRLVDVIPQVEMRLRLYYWPEGDG